MKREGKFLLGLAAGLGVVMAGRRAARQVHAIDFENRVVVITGGSRGLGLVLARQLAAEGARLCLIARHADELERARQQLEPSGAEIMTIACDVRNRDDVRAAIDQVLTRWVAIDVLINNAGVIQVGPLEHMTMTDFEDAMAIHFWGPLHTMYAVTPAMRRRAFGRIVNISSIGGRMAVPHLAPYSASKFALAGLSDAVRAELDQYGIRVTTVTPGLMRTGSPMNVDVKGQHEPEYALFVISDSLPGLSMSAERAARQILDACRHGDPELTVGLAARAAILANAVAPNLVGRLSMLATRLLPGPAGNEGDRSKKGWQSESAWAPSLATVLTDRAAAMNNEV